MSVDHPPCDQEIFKNGQSICTFAAASKITEPWVKKVAAESGQRVDWHYSGGRVNMLYLGDYAKVRAAIEKLQPELFEAGKTHEWGVSAFQIFGPGAAGLYRANVDSAPEPVVLIDPVAAAVIGAVEKHNCKNTFRANAERIAHFRQRAADRSGIPCIMVLLNVDDDLAGELAASLMPGHDWQAYRDRGEIPFARGLAGRAGMQELLDGLDAAEAEKLRTMTDVLPVVVMDHGVVAVFRADGSDL